jgi:phosphoketolase
LSSENYVNAIVCDKQKHLQFLSMDQAITHCTKALLKDSFQYRALYLGEPHPS